MNASEFLTKVSRVDKIAKNKLAIAIAIAPLSVFYSNLISGLSAWVSVVTIVAVIIFMTFIYLNTVVRFSYRRETFIISYVIFLLVQLLIIWLVI